MAIAGGVLLSFLLASPSLAAASAIAFALGELIDFAVYLPLSRRSLAAAVLGSGIAGAIVDSLVFLQIAFGSSMFWQGQVLGKLWIAVGAAALVAAVGSHRNHSRPSNGAEADVDRALT